MLHFTFAFALHGAGLERIQLDWTGSDCTFHISYCILHICIAGVKRKGRVGKLTYVLYCVLVGDGMGDDCDCDMI